MVMVIARIIAVVAMMVIVMMVAVMTMVVVMMVPSCGWYRAAGRDYANKAQCRSDFPYSSHNCFSSVSEKQRGTKVASCMNET
jgi:hypothetical protein